MCVLVTQKAHCEPIKIISEYISMFSEGRVIVLKYFRVLKISVPKKAATTSGTDLQLYWKQEHESEGEYILQYHFVDEIFPPYKCTHGPGEDPFEAVMCAVGAASQISCCLWKILFLIQNIT